MKLAANITRSLQAGMQAELRDIERAVASGTRDAGRGLRTELRWQVTSTGLNYRLAAAWRDQHYPGQPVAGAMSTVGSIVSTRGGSFGLGPIPAETGSDARSPHALRTRVSMIGVSARRRVMFMTILPFA